MKTKIIEFEDLGCKYLLLKHHRKAKSKEKSFWTISEKIEIHIFQNSYEKNWKDNNVAWGIFLEKGRMNQIGLLVNKTASYIAKFIDGNSKEEWHGYPADIIGNRQDVPNTKILQNWCEHKIIRKHQMMKIKRGIKCNL
ncbi:hypothetical protein LPTSP2_38900 [Leptospira ellinghausenii]|uniref:Uncharacterized protein n=1 Tax=Leptospira ellinghausenii TaxID=1917822 RepID=A0A2P2DIV0_9LEPT|nr:hypothetical protein [Leptospira ellinghausenii]GBF44587.1 hypothetical protein LPTSP2_38900 [Leptospira ellinghausenii]